MLCDRFCAAKEQQKDAGTITNRQWLDCYNAAALVVDSFGRNRLVEDLGPDDFDGLYAALIKKKYNPNTLANIVQRVRVVFTYADKNRLIDRPVTFGTTFRRPPKWQLRKLRDDLALKHGERAFEPAELLAMLNGHKVGKVQLEGADPPLKAMILLGINCGFGNNDCGKLPMRALDLKGGWVNFPRPKTGARRRCALWPETIKAIEEAIKRRPQHKDPEHAHLVFITKYGHSWSKDSPDGPVSKETTKLLKRLQLHRPGLGFYALRHTFETIGGDSRDQVAVDHIMGHIDSSMAERYRERIEDDRLKDVAGHVHKWLFGTKAAKKSK
jgi:integrase